MISLGSSFDGVHGGWCIDGLTFSYNSFEHAQYCSAGPQRLQKICFTAFSARAIWPYQVCGGGEWATIDIDLDRWIESSVMEGIYFHWPDKLTSRSSPARAIGGEGLHHVNRDFSDDDYNLAFRCRDRGSNYSNDLQPLKYIYLFLQFRLPSHCRDFIVQQSR